MSQQIPKMPKPLQRSGNRPSKSLMPVTVEQISSSATSATKAKLIVMQHALRDTAVFLQALVDAGFVVECFLAKPNSIEVDYLSQIKEIARTTVTEPKGYLPYQWYEEPGNLDGILVEVIEKAKADRRPVFIIDVGGYFAAPLRRLSEQELFYVKGVCEVTSFGHKRYLDQADGINVPVMSIARSPIKRAEAVFVGDTVVQATEDILRHEGKILRGRECAVFGFGMIGSEIGRCLKKRGQNVLVYEPDPLIALQAGLEGFDVVTDKQSALKNSEVVFAATGSRSISFADVNDYARNDVVLASGGSRANEFAVRELETRSISQSASRYSTTYTLQSGKRIHLLNQGKAVNFLKSGTPEEIMDLVFAELFKCMEYVLGGSPKTNCVTELERHLQAELAFAWHVRKRDETKHSTTRLIA